MLSSLEYYMESLMYFSLIVLKTSFPKNVYSAIGFSTSIFSIFFWIGSGVFSAIFWSLDLNWLSSNIGSSLVYWSNLSTLVSSWPPRLIPKLEASLAMLALCFARSPDEVIEASTSSLIGLSSLTGVEST